MSYQLNEEPCPVAESMLGRLYRSNPHAIAELVETVPPATRAMLAVYCYRRAHLASLALAVAANCDEHDLLNQGGMAGADLYARSRSPEQSAPETFYMQRRKVSLASGTLWHVPPLDDDIDDESFAVRN